MRQRFTVCQRPALTESEKLMNPKLGVVGLWLGCLVVVGPMRAAETNAVAGRVGVYDSRAVAFAWFSSDTQMAQLKEQMAAGRAAQAAGDETTFKEYSTRLRAKQDQIHREMFSTAPADEAMAALKGRIQEIEQAAGVSTLVSKWDEPAMKNHQGAEKVDVTDKLVRAFINPTEKQLKSIEAIEKATPLTLEKCDELIKKGEI